MGGGKTDLSTTLRSGRDDRVPNILPDTSNAEEAVRQLRMQTSVRYLQIQKSVCHLRVQKSCLILGGAALQRCDQSPLRLAALAAEVLQLLVLKKGAKLLQHIQD